MEVSWGHLAEEMDKAEVIIMGEINNWLKENPDLRVISITPVRNAHMGDFVEERYIELTVIFEGDKG